MATIYVYLADNQATFQGSDGRMYDQLWTIERKVQGNMQLCGATINGELRHIDFSVPTKVNAIPKGATPVPYALAQKLYHSDSWTFGY